MRRSFWEGLILSAVGVIIWLISFLRNRSGTADRNGRFSTANNNNNNSNNANSDDTAFFSFLKLFAQRGGLKHVFPGDDARDTSVQFELISQVNCTTSVGRPISVTVRNTPQDRRRMRMFGSYNDYQSF